MGTISLKREPDGMGFYYGGYLADDARQFRLDVALPRSHPRRPFVMASSAQHETDWIVYVDGVEIARARQQDELERAIVDALARQT